MDKNDYYNNFKRILTPYAYIHYFCISESGNCFTLALEHKIELILFRQKTPELFWIPSTGLITTTMSNIQIIIIKSNETRNKQPISSFFMNSKSSIINIRILNNHDKMFDNLSQLFEEIFTEGIYMYDYKQLPRYELKPLILTNWMSDIKHTKKMLKNNYKKAVKNKEKVYKSDIFNKKT